MALGTEIPSFFSYDWRLTILGGLPAVEGVAKRRDGASEYLERC